MLDELLAEQGLDGKSIRDEATSPEWKPRLRAETERARTLGIFGAPTFVADGELFWGNDRLESALDWLAGKRAMSDRPWAIPEGLRAPPTAKTPSPESSWRWSTRRSCAGAPATRRGSGEICAPDVVYFDLVVTPFRRVRGADAPLRGPARGKVGASRFEILNPHAKRSGDLAVLTFNFVSFGGDENGLRWNCTEVYRHPAGRLIQTHWSFTDSATDRLPGANDLESEAWCPVPASPRTRPGGSGSAPECPVP